MTFGLLFNIDIILFLVFVKSNKKKSKDFNYEKLLDRCEKEDNEKYINIVEK